MLSIYRLGEETRHLQLWSLYPLILGTNLMLINLLKSIHQLLFWLEWTFMNLDTIHHHIQGYNRRQRRSSKIVHFSLFWLEMRVMNVALILIAFFLHLSSNLKYFWLNGSLNLLWFIAKRSTHISSKNP